LNQLGGAPPLEPVGGAAVGDDVEEAQELTVEAPFFLIADCCLGRLVLTFCINSTRLVLTFCINLGAY
jgi:hypothetical protein